MKEQKELMEDEKKNVAIGASNANRPAFPSDFNYGDKDFLGAPVIVHRTSFGLTKREYFAAMAMQGLCASKDTDAFGEMESVAKQAVIAADELLKQLTNSTHS